MKDQTKKEIFIKKSQHAIALEKVPSEALAKAISDTLLKDKELTIKRKSQNEGK